jgi:hypothetical protein
MDWTPSEIIAMLRRAKEVGALSPSPHPDPLLGEPPYPEPDAGTDLAGEPIDEPRLDPGPEV